MIFPRLIDFKFTIERSYVVPAIYSGRADLISNELFGNPKFYKPLCRANNINCVSGLRIGIRTVEESIRIEGKNAGLNDSEIDELVNISYEERVPGNLDWNNYGDTFSGYVSDIYEGRLLLVPTIESCLEWLKKYDKIG